jgi:hypothetical protein
MAAAQQTSVAPVAAMQKETLKRRHSPSDKSKNGAPKRQRIATLLRNSRKRVRDEQNKSSAHKRQRMDDVDNDPVPELLSVEESEARIDAGLAMTLDFGVGTTADTTLVYDQEASENDSHHDISEENTPSPIGLTQLYDIDCKAPERHASSCTIGAM